MPNETLLVDISQRRGTSSNGPGLISRLPWSSPVFPGATQAPGELALVLGKTSLAEMDKQRELLFFLLFSSQGGDLSELSWTITFSCLCCVYVGRLGDSVLYYLSSSFGSQSVRF